MNNTLLKKVTASAAALSIVLSVVAPVVGVKAADASVDAANRLAALNVIEDHSNNPSAYNLGSSITRREMLKVMMNLSSVEVTETCTGKFSDLNASDWGCKYAEAALEAGFIAANARFRPNDMVTEAEALKMVMQARGVEAAEGVEPWGEAYRVAAVEAGILSADSKISATSAAKRSFVFVAADDAVNVTTGENAEDDEDDFDFGGIFDDLFGDDEDDNKEEGSEKEEGSDKEDDTGTGSNVKAGNVEITLNPATPAAMNVPRTAANVEYLVFDITAGSSDVSISEVVLQRVDLGSRDDFDKVWLSRDGVVVSTSKTIASDDTVTIPLNLTVKAGSTETLTVNASMKATGTKINAFQVVDVKSSANLKLGSLRGNSMTTVDYTVAEVTLNPKATGGSTVDVGSENKILGEFTLEETAASKKNAIVKSIRFRTTGSVDLTTDLANLALYNDGSKVSTETVIDGKNVTFKLPNVVIEDAKFKYYEIKADVIAGDDADTIAFSVKDDFDIYALEEGTGIGASIVKGTTLGTYTLNAGKITISQDTTTPSSTEYIKDSKNVLAFVAKVDLDQPVTVDALRLFLDSSSVLGGAQTTKAQLEKEIENVKLVVNDRVIDTVDTITAGAGGAANVFDGNAYYNFDSSFELKDNDLIKVYVDITRDAVAGTKLKFSINNTGLAATAGSSNSLRDVEYVTSGELVSTTAANNKLTGTATSNTVEVTSSAAGASMTRNDGLSNEVFLAGTKGASLMKFVVNSGNSSALEIRKLNFDFAAAGFVSTDLTNVKLLKNGSQVGSTEDVSSNSVTIESINDIIAKNSQATYELVADINTSATSTAIAVTLDASDSVFFDSNKNGVTTLAPVTGDTSIVRSNALLTVAVDGDTPSEAIILADTTNVEVAKYKFTANDGIVDIKDLYFRNVSTNADDSRISALKLVVNGKTIDSRVPSSNQVRFNLGSANKIQVPKNGNLVVSVVADLNRITAAGQTNKAIQLELTDVVADTNATSKALTKVENGGGAGTLIDNGDHYTTSALAALAIQSEELTIRKTQPQIAVQTLGTSKLVAGEQTIFKFTVTADSKADVDVAAINFNVVKSSVPLTIGGYKLFVNGSDKTADLVGGAFVGTKATFQAGKDQVVSAGSSKTFELKATIGGTIVTNDYVSVKIIEDTDSTDVGTFAQANDAGTSDSNFVWSDNAGSPHDRTTTDWFNGYNVKGLDTTTTTLTN